jgi:hypothetical protein
VTAAPPFDPAEDLPPDGAEWRGSTRPARTSPDGGPKPNTTAQARQISHRHT